MGLDMNCTFAGPIDLNQRAIEVMKRLHHDFASDHRKSSMTTSIYNTAWVSMIRKTDGGIQKWLFPQAFDSVLEHQLPDGGWQSLPMTPEEEASGIDGIVSTMASILAVTARIAATYGDVQALAARVRRGMTALDRMLQSWDVRSVGTVAVELIIPAHLEMLEQRGLTFHFDGQTLLMKEYRERIETFRPELLCGQEPICLVNCLEAFIGKVDFDQIARHNFDGGMLTSPSSTAAYLMQSSQWDDEAEARLRNAIIDGDLPNPYPSNIFEIIWVEVITTTPSIIN